MPRNTSKETKETHKPIRPALTPEARENQMIHFAMELAEQQLRDGTASSQVITHFLKLGSTKDKLEKEIMEKNKELLNAKTESLQSSKHMEELYKDAIKAFTAYGGHQQSPEENEEEDYEY